MSASQPAAQPNLLDDFGGFGAPSNPTHAQTNQPGPPMMNLMPQNNQPLISQSQPIMSTSTNQQFSMQSQQQNPMMYPNQGMMMASQSQGMMPQPAQGRPPQSKPVQSKPEVQSKVIHFFKRLDDLHLVSLYLRLSSLPTILATQILIFRLSILCHLIILF